MFDINLRGKTALVTGGAMGIGKSCALKLASAGADIILADISPEIHNTQEEIKSLGVACHLCIGDVFKEELINLLASLRSDILVCGPYKTIRKPAYEWSIQEFQEVIGATLISQLHLAGKVSAQMIANNITGKIIFISSVYGTLNRANNLGYDVAKAGLNQGMRVFARELAKYKINVNSIAPGYTLTPGEKKLASSKKLKESADSLPFGELCMPEDIGNLAVFLASDLASMITGQIMTVDGGYSLVDFSYDKKEII